MSELVVALSLYVARWQASTPILWFFTSRLKGWRGAVVANLIGALVFFWVDRWIFR